MSDAGTNGAVKRGSPLWMKALLGLSLAANMVFVGMLANWAMYERGKRIDGLDRRQSRIVKVLPESRQEEARQLFISKRPEIAEKRDGLREIHSRIVAVLRADAFTVDALRDAFEQRRRISGEMHALNHQYLMIVVERMSPAERIEFADRLEELAKRWERRNATR